MSESDISHNNTCAVIVTYHPDKEFQSRLKLVENQFSLVIIVDNRSRPSSVEILRRLLNDNCSMLIENSENLGIAAALNQGVDIAIQKGYDFVVTLDQDTVIHANFLDSLIDIYHEKGGDGNIIGSNYWDVHKGKNFLQCNDKIKICTERKTLITSGTLFPITLFQKIGYFREDYFIDSVDHEFCLRAKSSGFRSFISCRPIMNHSIGPGVVRGNLLRQRLSLNHAPERKYFIARNSIVTARTYFFQEPIWSIRQGTQLMAILLSILIFEQDKLKQLKAIIVGIFHGIIGKMGPVEKAWPNGSL